MPVHTVREETMTDAEGYEAAAELMGEKTAALGRLVFEQMLCIGRTAGLTAEEMADKPTLFALLGSRFECKEGDEFGLADSQQKICALISELAEQFTLSAMVKRLGRDSEGTPI